jgi:nucleoside 2-deoxyribosyltransferase
VILPQEKAANMLAGAEAFNPTGLFQANINGIDHCDVVVAVLDGADADSGTAWECGYAYKIGRPVIGIRTDLRLGGDDPKAPVNLMLSHACKQFVILPLAKRDDESWLVENLIAQLARVYQLGPK